MVAAYEMRNVKTTVVLTKRGRMINGSGFSIWAAP